VSDQPAAHRVRFASYNMLDMYGSDEAGERERHAQVVAVIRELDADVIAVQELSSSPETADAGLASLADAVGMHCSIRQRSAKADLQACAVAAGPHGLHVGLMWRDGIEPLPHTWRAYGGEDFWHSLAKITLDVGGHQVTHASFHAAPFGRQRRNDEAEQVVAALAGPISSPPALVGADWNTVGADRLRDEQTQQWQLYDPDPYAGAPWISDMIYQCEWAYDDSGARRHWADRHAADILSSGGLHDVAAVLRAPWQPTIGHWPDSELSRHGITARFDAIRVTEQVVPALHTHRVVRTSLSLSASDHLPVVIEYDPEALGRPTPVPSR